MVYMEWTEELSVGISEIDEQHKKLISIINKAHEINGEGSNEVLGELLEFTRTHFSTEEGYFEKYHYPEAEEHIAEHVRLLKTVMKFYDRFKAGEDVLNELLEFLKKELEVHLKVWDQKYAEFFRRQGLS